MKTRTRKYGKRKGSRKTKRGGFLFKKPTVLPNQCNPNNLSMIQSTTALYQNYQQCCPKTMLGFKNSSPYCKQVDLNLQAAVKRENMELGNSDEIENESFITPAAQLQPREYDLVTAQTKPWYKFWGGKKTKKHRKSRK